MLLQIGVSKKLAFQLIVLLLRIMYVKFQPGERKQLLCHPDISMQQMDDLAKAGFLPDDAAHENAWIASAGAYGLSKALAYCYTMYTAKTLADKNIISTCLSPGFIATNIIPDDHKSSAKPVEEGTVSLRHCLFETTMDNNGWFYGSDAKRSPPHYMRNPGEPEYDGKLPW